MALISLALLFAAVGSIVLGVLRSIAHLGLPYELPIVISVGGLAVCIAYLWLVSLRPEPELTAPLPPLPSPPDPLVVWLERQFVFGKMFEKRVSALEWDANTEYEFQEWLNAVSLRLMTENYFPLRSQFMSPLPDNYWSTYMDGYREWSYRLEMLEKVTDYLRDDPDRKGALESPSEAIPTQRRRFRLAR